MKSYGSGKPPRVTPMGIAWDKIVTRIETEGHLGEWVSPEELQDLPNLMSAYAIVKRKEHPHLRDLEALGYEVKGATTNTKTVDGRRSGDLLLFVTKEG